MPPVTQKPPITAQGQAAKNRIAEVRQNVNNGLSNSQARAVVRKLENPNYQSNNLPPANTPNYVGFAGSPRLNPTIPTVIPSTALAGNRTFEDVMDTRADLETKATAKAQLQERIQGVNGRIGTQGGATFADPDAMINRLLLNRVPTATQTQRTDTFNQAQANRRDFGADIATARTQANEQFGVPDLVARKAEVTQQYAEREAKLDADIKRIEENAAKRGVPREFVEAEKQKIKSDALEDLANFAAIEAAVSGSITEARSIINDTINDKKAAFELENQAIQADIDYLNTLVGEENQQEASQLQFALNERKRLQDQQLAQETEIKELMVNVASEGADEGTINAIKNATSVEEAIRFARPFLGRTERLKVNDSIAQGWAGIQLRQDELALARQRFESESSTFGSGTVTTEDGQKAVITSDGTVTPISEIDFNNPEQIDALPVGDLTKAVMNGFAKTKDLTPTQKGQVIAELQNIGFNPNTYVVNKLNSLVETWAALPEDSRGYVQGLKFWESKTRPEVATFESQKQLLTREIARLFDVGVLSDQDVAAYKDAMPSRQDSSIDVVISKTAGIAGAAAGTNPQQAGKRIRLDDGTNREAIVGADGETLLDPLTGKPLE